MIEQLKTLNLLYNNPDVNGKDKAFYANQVMLLLADIIKELERRSKEARHDSRVHDAITYEADPKPTFTIGHSFTNLIPTATHGRDDDGNAKANRARLEG